MFRHPITEETAGEMRRTYSTVSSGVTGFCLAWRITGGVLLGGLLVALPVGPVMAEGDFLPSSIKTGVLLVASPSLADPNFHHTVLLILKHGPEGTAGLVLNRSTDVMLSEVLPDWIALKGTSHRVFVGGPVAPTQVLMLFRLTHQPVDAQRVFDGVYVGGTRALLERIVTQPMPTETFRAFVGFAGWAPGQLEFEMNQGSWGVLPSDSFNLFDKDPATLWPDCLARLQAPRAISN
jgi:putative transcriptional regulator